MVLGFSSRGMLPQKASWSDNDGKVPLGRVGGPNGTRTRAAALKARNPRNLPDVDVFVSIRPSREIPCLQRVFPSFVSRSA
jgi:hypothetical protein